MRLPAARAGRIHAGTRYLLTLQRSGRIRKSIDLPIGGSEMRRRVLPAIGLSAVVLVAVILLLRSAADQPGRSALNTAWGEPNLQGIWTDEYTIPLQRPAKYASKEFFTDE